MDILGSIGCSFIEKETENWKIDDKILVAGKTEFKCHIWKE